MREGCIAKNRRLGRTLMIQIRSFSFSIHTYGGGQIFSSEKTSRDVHLSGNIFGLFVSKERNRRAACSDVGVQRRLSALAELGGGRNKVKKRAEKRV